MYNLNSVSEASQSLGVTEPPRLATKPEVMASLLYFSSRVNSKQALTDAGSLAELPTSMIEFDLSLVPDIWRPISEYKGIPRSP